jgi:hypothetical protein
MGQLWSVLGLLVACGPEARPEAEREELCGQDGAVRVLELSDAELLYGAGETDRVDDRRILPVAYRSETLSESEFPEIVRTETWSVGMCGESPILLDVDRAFRYEEAWPDVLLGCRDATGEFVALDPLGEREPHVVLTTPECRGWWTPHGLVTRPTPDAETSAVMVFPWVDDPWTQTAEPRVIIEAIRAQGDPSRRFSITLQVTEDVAFGLTPADELVSVALTDFAVTTEATNVRELEVSNDGRFVAWQDLAPSSDDDSWPAGAIYVKDRVDGTTTYLTDTSLAASFDALQFVDHGVVRLQMGYEGLTPERIFFLSGAPPIDLPLWQSLLHRLDDGRWLVGSFSGGAFTLYDPQLLEARQIYNSEGRIMRLEDGIEIFESIAVYPELFLSAEAPVSFVPWDGAPTRLAGRVTLQYKRLRDGRIITPVDTDEFRMGSLVVAAARREDEQRIDDHVLTNATVNDDDEAIVYGVLDGDRTGVWVTKLAD